MKKLILSMSVVALLASCGSKEKEEKGHDEKEATKTEEAVAEVVDETPKELSFDSFDFLTRYSKEGEDFLATLKGNNITISQVIVGWGDLNYMYGYGYNGSQLTLISSPESYPKIVRGENVQESLAGPVLGIEILKSTATEPVEMVPSENVINDGIGTDTYHTEITLLVSGNDIEAKNATTLIINGAQIITHENF